MRRPPASTVEASYDSFLDIVANLVGILVILIMVLGVRTQDAWQDADKLPPESMVSASMAPLTNSVGKAATIPEADTRVPLPEVEMPRQQAAMIREHLFELDKLAQGLAREVAIQRQKRGELQLQVHRAEQEMKEIERRVKARKGETVHALATSLATAERNRQHLREQLHALTAATSAPTVLRNEPTPLARPVDGHEIHLRLLGGRVAYVPVSESVARLSQVVREKVWRLKDAHTVKAQLEPRDGFVMHYTLVRQLLPGGREAPGLGGFEMVPQSDQLGEEFAVAVAANSELAARLSDYDPGTTTVTVWTYPDSFSYFRDLRTYLLDRGFQVAARPLPRGHPIGGSPQGSRSAAQ